MKTLMLWEKDFKEKRDWNTLCDVLCIPRETTEIELHVDVIGAFMRGEHERTEN